MGRYPTGVTIVTAMDEGRPVGLAVGTFTSVSLDPPLVAFLPDRKSRSWPVIEKAGKFCANVVGDHQEHVSGTFASKAEDKFAEIPWQPSPVTGSPMIAGCVAWLDCEVDVVHEAGDHWIVIGRVLELDVSEDEGNGPLLFFKGGYGRFAP
jgi:3-hydroxy-9,10-secoandrosta-1,3,5(10)-triene-9,17-dione monooxygenase reductase component